MDEFDDLFDDLVIKGTITRKLPGVFVRSDRPLALIMKHAGDANPAYRDMHTKTTAERAAIRDDELKMRAYNIRLFARTVIVGWENCNKPDGSPYPYSADLAIKLCDKLIAKDGTDKLSEAFFAARDPANFRGSPVAAADALGK